VRSRYQEAVRVLLAVLGCTQAAVEHASSVKQAHMRRKGVHIAHYVKVARSQMPLRRGACLATVVNLHRRAVRTAPPAQQAPTRSLGALLALSARKAGIPLQAAHSAPTVPPAPLRLPGAASAASAARAPSQMWSKALASLVMLVRLPLQGVLHV